MTHDGRNGSGRAPGLTDTARRPRSRWHTDKNENAPDDPARRSSASRRGLIEEVFAVAGSWPAGEAMARAHRLEAALAAGGPASAAYGALAVAWAGILTGTELDRAAAKARQARTTLRRRRDRPGYALALCACAAADAARERNGAALRDARRAAAIAATLNDAATQALALGLMGQAKVDLGMARKGLASLERALAFWVALGDRREEGRTLDRRAQARIRLGQLDEATADLEHAVMLAVETGDRQGEATADTHLATLLMRVGRFLAALEHLGRALDIDDALQSTGRNHIVRLMHRSRVRLHLGELQAALSDAEGALACAQALEQPEIESWTLENLGMVYAALGRPGKAIQYYSAALPVLQAAGNRDWEAVTVANVARLLAQTGQHRQALALLEARRALFRRVGLQGIAQAIAGYACEQLGDPRAAIARYRRAIAPAPSDHQDVSWEYRLTALLHLGRLLGARGRPRDALRYLRQAQRTVRRAQAGYVALVDAEIGAVYEQMGRRRTAHRHYRRAVDLLEGQRSTLLVREHRRAFFEARLHPHHRLIPCCIRLGRLEEAFEEAEQARSRTLVDALEEAAQSGEVLVAAGKAEPDVSRRLTAVQRELRAALNRREELVFAGQGPAVRALRQRVGEAIERLEEAIGRQGGEADSRPDAVAVLSPPRVSVDDIRQDVLDDRTALLEYFISDTEAVAFVVTRRDGVVAAVPLDLRGVSLEQLVQRCLPTWRVGRAGQQWLHPEVPLGHLERAYRLLVAPVAGALPGWSRLLIVPHGPLHGLPFHALWSAEDGFLADRFPEGVHYAPSAWTGRYCRTASQRAAPRSALILANPQCRRDGLPGAELEGRVVAGLFHPRARLLTGRAATRAALLAGAADADVLHLSCHGDFAEHNPLLSALILAGDDNGAADDPLTVYDLFGLRLKSTLVTLSGCVTGRTLALGGDEVAGLCRGFFYAGAPSVLMALWEVNDFATTLLMQAFYHRWREGAEKATALHRAQVAIRALTAAEVVSHLHALCSDLGERLTDEHGPAALVAAEIARVETLPESVTVYENPFYWAPFVLCGAAE